jgi:hypothetical protein
LYSYPTPSPSYYSFPAGSAGMAFMVNGYTWAITGPLDMEVETSIAPDAWQVFWNGHTNVNTEFPNGVFNTPTTMTMPIPMNGLNLGLMLFGPTFKTGTLSGNDLPTWMNTSQFDTMTPGLIMGAVYQEASDGSSYFFNFGNPGELPPNVPLPSTLLLLGSGLLGCAGWRRFMKN